MAGQDSGNGRPIPFITLDTEVYPFVPAVPAACRGILHAHVEPCAESLHRHGVRFSPTALCENLNWLVSSRT